VKRWLLAILLAALTLAAVYQFGFRDKVVSPRVVSSQPTSMIGTGSSAVGVSADGTVLSWLPLPANASLPQLPLSTPPKQPRLAGTALQQARVLGAAPTALRPYIQSSFYGTSGVDVELKAGVELRFGDASRAAQKWKAAAAVLAAPSVTSLDYVDLHAPGRPDVGGSGHTLPSAP
jgi:hypothetical protein